MERTKFIASIIGIFATPFLAFAEFKKKLREEKGFKVKEGEGRFHGNIKLKGVNSNVLDVKISGKDTDGGLAIFQQTSLSQGRGTPLHIHPFQDEIFYVVEGAYYFQVGDDKFNLTTGENIFLPRNVPHAWTQVSEKGKMNVTFQPAGKLEEFFVTLSNLDHEPTPQEMTKLFLDHEMKIVGPPLKIE